MECYSSIRKHPPLAEGSRRDSIVHDSLGSGGVVGEPDAVSVRTEEMIAAWARIYSVREKG